MKDRSEKKLTKSTPGKPAIRWRFDNRCGSKYPLPDGKATECDPDGDTPCCSEEKGECGSTADHCTCERCNDFRDVKKWIEEGMRHRELPSFLY